MPSFYISSFAVSKDPRENQKRSRGRRKQPLSNTSRAVSILGGCSPFSRASAFIRKKEAPGFHAMQKMPRVGADTVSASRAPRHPQSSPLLPAEAGRAGAPGACSTVEGPQLAMRWMEATPSILLPHLPPPLSSPPKRRGEEFAVTPRLQISCFPPPFLSSP